MRGGTVVDAAGARLADVLVRDGRIVAVEPGLVVGGLEVVDAGGAYVVPGGIDVHTHLDMPFGGTTSADDFESGTIAAAHGGEGVLDLVDGDRLGDEAVQVEALQFGAKGEEAVVVEGHRRLSGGR